MSSTQAPRLGQRKCPVLEGTPKHCGATVRPEYLMCGRHWAQVPKDLQTPVWRFWRAWQRTSTDAMWEQYMAARHAALQFFIDQDAEARATPSLSLTWDDLDDAALVLIVAPDGTSRMWFGGDQAKAARVLQTVWADLNQGAVIDSRPT